MVTPITGLFLILNLAGAAGLGGDACDRILEWPGQPSGDEQSIVVLAMMTCIGLILQGFLNGLPKLFGLE
ncbi:hypothetical protein [Nitrospirillum sp. BR 11163]|uniref:hypothetical protein n=1 Tax=Nitrospirillum sp. BR 11163 TaxID=3104323 RepID=UPI002AFE7334|nr:hypothetical protein [Nitrospirillum sp. BR 11163]MEA1674523.1 hypothetical protein [Nitrospirillum sp. BR 11163]